MVVPSGSNARSIGVRVTRSIITLPAPTATVLPGKVTCEELLVFAAFPGNLIAFVIPPTTTPEKPRDILFPASGDAGVF